MHQVSEGLQFRDDGRQVACEVWLDIGTHKTPVGHTGPHLSKRLEHRNTAAVRTVPGILP